MGLYVSQSQFRSATLPYLENSVVSKRNTFRRTVGAHLKMDTEQQLDTVLSIIDKSEDWLHSRELRRKVSTDITNSQLDRLIIDKLSLDGFIDIKEDNSINKDFIVFPFYCRTTYHGRLFLERGGYKSQRARRIVMTAWTITKTIANIANAVIVIGIAIAAVWVSWSQWQQDVKNNEDITNIEKRIELLENALKPDSINEETDTLKKK